MSFLEALILGIIQGLTEYLPVSSSGHLELGKIMMDIQTMDKESPFGITFNVVLHLATVFSTWVVFRKEIAEIFKGLFQFKVNEEFWFSVKIVVSMIPAGIVGILFADQIDATFSGKPGLIGLMLLLTGALLFLADKAKITNRKVTIKDAIIIGIAQMIALIPGISRSGATIGTSVLLKIDKERAARFSFLMVMPLILGKVAKDLVDGEFAMSAADAMPMLVGFFASFFVGLLACNWMLSLVKKGKLVYFSIYCFIVGSAAIAYSLLQTT